MLRYIIITMLAGLFSCTSNNDVKEWIISSDSVAINYFKGDGSRDSVYQVVILKDKKQIESLAGYMTGSSSENYKCSYDGSIQFYKNRTVILDAEFRMNLSGCMHFAFVYNDKLYSTKMSEEAKQFLKSAK